MELNNEHPDFVGLEVLKAKQAAQLHEFQQWAALHNWQAFHINHYDWWMFPIDQPSRLGFAYTVFSQDIAALKSDEVFMQNYLEGVRLLLLSWGWNLEAAREIESPEPGQIWANWPIRLSKCAQSLALFGCQHELSSVLRYGKLLLKRGADFHFRGKDLSGRFLMD